MAKKKPVKEKKKSRQAKKIKYDVWKAAAVIFALLFLISLIIRPAPSKTKLSKGDVASKTLDFIQKYAVQNQTPASIGSIEDLENENCLYNITIDIQGSRFESYVTKDGAWLFPQGVNLNNPVLKVQRTQQSQQG